MMSSNCLSENCYVTTRFFALPLRPRVRLQAVLAIYRAGLARCEVDVALRERPFGGVQ